MNRRDLIAGSAAAAVAATLPIAGLGPSLAPPWAQALRGEPIRKAALMQDVVMIGDLPTKRLYMQIWYAAGGPERIEGSLVREALNRIRDQHGDTLGNSREFLDDADTYIRRFYA